jgi:L-lactate dehydrogenase complex protein LldF
MPQIKTTFGFHSTAEEVVNGKILVPPPRPAWITSFAPDKYLEQFEQNATKRGTHVHWARDAEEHNTLVHDILQAHGVKSLIKSKSMLQEECGMTPYLQKRGIEVTESDLGERIQQLSNEAPSHIVVPAIHKLRSDVAALFAKDIGTDPNDFDPHHLTEAMRQAARPRFMVADAGMTGANFAVAETGGFVVCTNEGLPMIRTT